MHTAGAWLKPMASAMPHHDAGKKDVTAVARDTGSCCIAVLLTSSNHVEACYGLQMAICLGFWEGPKSCVSVAVKAAPAACRAVSRLPMWLLQCTTTAQARRYTLCPQGPSFWAAPEQQCCEL